MNARQRRVQRLERVLETHLSAKQLHNILMDMRTMLEHAMQAESVPEPACQAVQQVLDTHTALAPPQALVHYSAALLWIENLTRAVDDVLIRTAGPAIAQTVARRVVQATAEKVEDHGRAAVNV